MNYSFNIDIAALSNERVATFVNNLAYWLLEHISKGQNIHDNKVWNYCTMESLQKLYPYLSIQNIRTMIATAESKGLIEKGNYNKAKYDRTLWYTLTHKALNFYPRLKDMAQLLICENQQMDLPESTNGSVETNTPIPDRNKQIEITDINTSCVSQETQPATPVKTELKEHPTNQKQSTEIPKPFNLKDKNSKPPKEEKEDWVWSGDEWISLPACCAHYREIFPNNPQTGLVNIPVDVRKALKKLITDWKLAFPKTPKNFTYQGFRFYLSQLAKTQWATHPRKDTGKKNKLINFIRFNNFTAFVDDPNHFF